MRNFDHLSQDEQMQAVDQMRKDILEMALGGSLPACWEPFQYEVEGAHADANANDTPWFAGQYLMERLDANRDMELAMLHQAGKVAKMAWYPDDDEFIIRLKG